MGKSKVLSRGFCSRDSEAEQRLLQFLHIYCSIVHSYSSAPRSIKPNPWDKNLHLPFFFCYKHLTSLKNLPSPAPNESLPYWFQGNFVASFALNFWLREFLLSAFANSFELRCETKQLMLLYYKICPCSSRQKFTLLLSLKLNHLSLAQGESLPYWFQGNFCVHVCFDFLVERIFFV